jgi:hypothetical protein
MGYDLSSDRPPRAPRSFTYHHPPVSLALFLTLEDAISEAWDWLHQGTWRGFSPQTAKEVGYTAHLHIILQSQLLDAELVPGFTTEVFIGIERQETVNHDLSKLSKRPDMLARIANRPSGVDPSQDGIFIECKPVDAKPNHSLTSAYCEEGIRRFVVGDYAWAMTEALMVGYNTVHPKPSEALKEPFQKQRAVVLPVGGLSDCPQSVHHPPVAISRHERIFPLGDAGKKAPPIQLRHLWLKAPAKS